MAKNTPADHLDELIGEMESQIEKNGPIANIYLDGQRELVNFIVTVKDKLSDILSDVEDLQFDLDGYKTELEDKEQEIKQLNDEYWMYATGRRRAI